MTKKILKINNKQVKTNAQGGGFTGVEFTPEHKIIKGSSLLNDISKKVKQLKGKEFYYNSGPTRIKITKSELLKTLKMTSDYWVMIIYKNYVTIYSFRNKPKVEIVDLKK